jgi:hypothetical protein
VVDTIEDINPELCEKMMAHEEGYKQLLDVEGVGGCIYEHKSIVQAEISSEVITSEDLAEFHKKHERILETVSQWKLPKREEKKKTPFEIFCKIYTSGKPFSAKGLANPIDEALGFETSVDLFWHILIAMEQEYDRTHSETTPVSQERRRWSGK